MKCSLDRPGYQALMNNEKLQFALREAEDTGTVKIFSNSPQFHVLDGVKQEGYRNVRIHALWTFHPWHLNELKLMASRSRTWMKELSHRRQRILHGATVTCPLIGRTDDRVWTVSSWSSFRGFEIQLEKMYTKIVGRNHTFWVRKDDPTSIVWDDRVLPYDRNAGWSMGTICRILMAWTEEMIGISVPFVEYAGDNGQSRYS
jgi:hypothetical protein